MHRQVKRTLFVIAAIFMLIFGQLQVAAYACSVADTTASTQQTAMVTMHGDMGEYDTAVKCQSHCDNNAQSDHAPQPAVSPVVWLPVIWGLSDTAGRAAASIGALPRAAEPLLLYPPPPSRILFQVFRT